VTLRRGDLRIRYFSTLCTFGTPQDITLQELRIKCFFPADAQSAEAFRHLPDRQAHSARGTESKGKGSIGTAA
jgi:hypothetical protein